MTAFSATWLFALLFNFGLLSSVVNAQKILDYGVIGTGCAPGSTSVTISDGTNISLKYADFTAKAGPGLNLSEGRKSCQLTLTLAVPTNKQFAIQKYTFKGGYALDAKVTGTISTNYYFQSDIQQSTSSKTITGAISESSATFDSYFSDAVWSPCGASEVIIGISTSIRISAQNTASGRVQLYEALAPALTWRNC